MTLVSPDDMSGEPVGSCRDCGGDIFGGDDGCPDWECRLRTEWVDELVEHGVDEVFNSEEMSCQVMS